MAAEPDRPSRRRAPGRRRSRTEAGLVRLAALVGIVALALIAGIILVSVADVRGWIDGLAIGAGSVILTSVVWNSKRF